MKKFKFLFKSFGIVLIATFFITGLSGCEKISNSAKNIQSDWIGIDRNVEIYSCMTGKLIKSFQGSVRLNPGDTVGTSLLIDGKKLHTNLCFIISEIGLKERNITHE